jgi:DNA transposition AAA+ family ATPase
MLKKLVKENGTKSPTVAAAIGCSDSLIRQFINNEDRKLSQALLDKLREYLISVGYWEDDDIPAPPSGGFKTSIKQMDFVETETVRRVRFVLQNSIEACDFGMVCGPSGCGKTYTVLQWMKERPGDAIFIRAHGCMTRKAILKRIAKAMELRTYGDADTMIEHIRDELIARPRLIIFDEADQFNSIKKFELLRSIYDECDIAGAPFGVVFIGNEDLAKYILQAAADKEELARIHNRFGAFQRVEMPNREEAERLLEGYNTTPKARELLIAIIRNRRKGGIRVCRKVLAILLGAVGGKPITEDLVLSDALARSVLSLNA